MSTFDSNNNQEGTHDTGRSMHELIGHTEIGAFERSGLVSTEQILDYLHDRIPLTHFEHCPSIRYDPDHAEFAKNPHTLAFLDNTNRDIHVGPAERFQDDERLFYTVTHEVGHNVYENLRTENPYVATRWDDLHAQSLSAGEGFVSYYARTNPNEDFAETYAVYVTDPEYLQLVSPVKYEFMRSQIFSGREYQLHMLGDLSERSLAEHPSVNDNPEAANDILSRPNLDISDVIGLVSNEDVQKTAEQVLLRFEEGPRDVRMNMVAFD